MIFKINNHRLPKSFKTWCISMVADVATTCLSTFAAARLEDLYERIVYGPLADQLKDNDKPRNEVSE